MLEAFIIDILNRLKREKREDSRPQLEIPIERPEDYEVVIPRRREIDPTGFFGEDLYGSRDD